MSESPRPWYTLLNRYHWFVLIVAALGWLFDTMDQQLFTFARQPAMTELLSREQTVTVDGEEKKIRVVNEDAAASESPIAMTKTEVADAQDKVKKALSWGGTLATSIFLIGWATGGLVFGVIGDKIGRAKTMLLTILLYSLFTGLSAFSRGFLDFAAFRFLTGLGVGGEFAVGVALVAEVMPAQARAAALGTLQALSAVGNITAALISMYLGHLQGAGDISLFGHPFKAWRIMFLIGTVPALLAIVIRAKLKEPERWQSVSHDGAVEKQLGSYAELFGNPRWRKNALAGMMMAFAGVVGLWGVGFFTPELTRPVLEAKLKADGLSPDEIESGKAFWVGIMFIIQNIGGALGIWAYAYVTQRTGRKPAFAVAFVLAAGMTAYVFWNLKEFNQIFWMIPIMGFCQLSLFGGYAIYFPELFPTHLRSTGTSFCYNVGRFVAASGPVGLGLLTTKVFTEAKGYQDGFRYAAVAMSSVLLLGLVALLFAPETRGQELPE